MLNLNELQSVQARVTQRNSQRAEQYDKSYAKGLELLETYHRQPGKEVLKQAMYCFIDCMTQQRDRVEPLVVLAYIYYCLKSPQLASKYYRLAAAIDAQAAPVKRLQQILIQQPAILTVAQNSKKQNFSGPEAGPESLANPVADHPGAHAGTHPAVNPAVGELDYDALYEELAELIDTELHRVMRMQFKRELALDARTLAHVSQQQAELSQNLASHQAQLALLEAEFDVSELQRKLRPIEVRLKQFKEVYMQSMRAQNLVAEIQNTVQAVELESLRVPLRASALDEVLDRCDSLADQIDDIEKLGFEIKGLEKPYNQLLSAIHLFQDLLEDLA